MAITHRWKVIGVATLVVLSSAFFFAQVGKTFVPEEDESRFVISVHTPLGSNLDYTSGKISRGRGHSGQAPGCLQLLRDYRPW